MQPHRLAVRVYLEDTDAQGIVYHANYLKYFERARSDLLEATARALPGQAGTVRRFVVHEIESQALVGAQVDVVCVDAAGELIELPAHLRLD